MRVLGLVGSPRKNGNTDLLVSSVLDGASASGHIAEKLYLYDLDISPCVDCRRCKKDDFRCAVDDDMTTLYSKLEGADVIVFGTPLYWYGPTGKMKLMIDRLRPFVASKKLKGKKAILVTPSEEGPGACDCLVRMFELSFKYLGIDLTNKILVTAYDKAEVREQLETLNGAFEVGKALK
ncbi:MAG: flavodoxin family protein [Candidatus Bathyarchaeota archaeon]|nr:flavodoxin family protein [Candidatus Bathyarchaeota archaeon]